MIRSTLASVALCAASTFFAPASAFPLASAAFSDAPQAPCSRPAECRRRARMAFDSEMARVGKECVGIKTQHDDTMCQGEAAAATDRNLTVFVDALEGIVGTGALRASQQAWSSYRKAQCDAVFDFFHAGTIAPSARARCDIELARSRMRDLNVLYDGPLHH
jgi:uncharacterized protein YecT (DUF1311 family)